MAASPFSLEEKIAVITGGGGGAPARRLPAGYNPRVAIPTGGHGPMAASPFSLEKKIAVITGGGVGIGRSIALEFAKAGADVVICSRKIENLEPVTAEIKKLGRRSFCMAVDVREEEAV